MMMSKRTTMIGSLAISAIVTSAVYAIAEEDAEKHRKFRKEVYIPNQEAETGLMIDKYTEKGEV